MKFVTGKQFQEGGHRFVLIDSIKSLPLSGLGEKEQKFCKERFKKSSKGLVSINNYPGFDHIVLLNPDKKDASQLSEELRLLGTKGIKQLQADKASSAYVISHADTLDPHHFAEGLALASYEFVKYKSDHKKSPLKQIAIENGNKAKIAELNAVLKGVFKARDLVNEPLSYLTAKRLADEVEAAGERHGFKTEILNKKKIESLKMGGLLAVNYGSPDPPTFSILEYKPKSFKNKKPLVLVGKGVVYDTGGLSLKPTAGSMDEMKSDMAGAAAVIGTMIALAEAKLPVHAIALVPATDNRPGQNAYVPGDVIKMYNGSTVEVLNTDAEGRMLLADALAYASKYKPELVMDLATLTGAAAIAIGKYGIVGMGTAGDEAFEKLEESGRNVFERIARFPFWDEYNELLKSNVADVKNIGGREAGAITAGKFLERFTDYPWIHLDIAGPAFLKADHGYKIKGGTGVGVRLLFDFLKNYA